uniref:Uncharacterized protein n=1 Tax=Panagrolaimus sp. ES5 TaxID=591445 RepID=A0AC34F4W9_9BILA
MKFQQIQAFFAFLSSIFLIVNGHVCAEYKQEFSTKNRIDASKNPNLVVYSNECKGCVATIENGNFQTFCDNMESSLCETSKTLNCKDKTCCCSGMFCYDQLRNHFASSPAPSLIECVVQRKTKSINEPESESDDDMSYSRNTCSICVAEYKGNAIESRCIESKDVHSECLFATELTGGNLACTKDGKKCCCRSDNCQEQFEKLFFENGDLGKSLISEPYASQTSKLKSNSSASFSNLFFIGISVILFFTTFLLL